MKKPKPMTGEVLYARVPAGTKERVAAVRGVERESDWFRRLVLETLDRAEAGVSTKRSNKALAHMPLGARGRTRKP